MALTTQVREFLKEVQLEFTKVSWPARAELRDSTVVVIVSVLLVSLFISAVDNVLRLGIGLLFR